jgi:hypothetical protein
MDGAFLSVRNKCFEPLLAKRFIAVNNAVHRWQRVSLLLVKSLSLLAT